MNGQLSHLLGAGLLLAMSFSARGQTNSWIGGSSKWETTNNWSLGVAPSTSDAADLITNVTTKTVTIDSNTPVNNLTIEHLSVSAPGGSTNTLQILNVDPGESPFGTPFQINDALFVGAGGSVLVSNSSLSIVSSNTINNGRMVNIDDFPTALQADDFLFTVTGPSATFSNIDAVIFAYANSNTVVVSNGGRVDTGDLYIGLSADNPLNPFPGFNLPANFDAVTITGTNSQINVGLLSIGDSGSSNAFIIGNGGTLRIQGILALSSSANTISNLVELLPGGTLVVGQNVFVGNTNNTQAAMQFAGGSSTLFSNLVAGSFLNSTGSVTVTGGQLAVTNGVIGVGNDSTLTNGFGVGTMTVFNATVLANKILLGSSVGGQGQLTVQTNGLVSLVGTGAVLVANDLTIAGGDVEIVNGIIYCGQTHPGAMTMSNGTANCQMTYVGYDSQGTLSVYGGQMTLSSLLEIGQLSGSTGSVWMSGGQLTATALTTTIGNQGVGQMSISNGVVAMANVVVGNSGGPGGTLTLAGGTLTVNTLSLLTLSSQFNFTGGWLNALGITNSNGQMLTLGNGVTPITVSLLGGISSLGNGLQVAANATFTGSGTINGNIVNYGFIAASSGPLTFTGIVTNNGLIITNSSIHFSGGLVNNGTLEAPVTVSPLTLPGGMINVAYSQTITASGGSGGYTFSVLSGALPPGLSLNASNGAITGTPTTPGSATFTMLAADSNGYPGTQQYTVVISGPFAITSVARQGNNILVTWNCAGGYTNVVQSTQNVAGGGYSSNLFSNVSPLIILGGVGQSTTNYLDAGAATNSPALFYRVRLVQ